MIAYHADHVGSLLRPAGLITGREDAAARRISRARFRAIEDRAVEDAIRLQERVGLPVITDGEQRRLSFQSRFAESVSGLGDWTIERSAGLGVVKKLQRDGHELSFAKPLGDAKSSQPYMASGLNRQSARAYSAHGAHGQVH